jgi:hypothetical protein
MEYSYTPPPPSAVLHHPPHQFPSPALTSRGITTETLAYLDIVSPGKPLTIATPVYKHQRLVGWKYRTGGWSNSSDKVTSWAPGSERWLIGTQKWDGNRCHVYLCEGETDMAAVTQHTNCDPRHLAVCLGGNPLDSHWVEWLGWIAQAAEHVHLCFDNDKHGDKYLALFEKHWGYRDYPPVDRIDLPPDIKDVADLLLQGHPLTFASWPSIPDTILSASQVRELAICGENQAAITTGDSYLDMLIEGYRPGKIVVLAGLPKQGKSSYCAWLAMQYITTHKKPVLIFSLELTADESLGSFDKVSNEYDDYLYFVKAFGYITPEFLVKHLHACAALGIKLVVIDHITAACTQFGSEGLTTQALDGFMYHLQALANELGLYVLAVSHVNSGCTGTVTPRDLRGSLSITQVADCVFGVQRLDTGMTEIRTVIPDRVMGVQGRINYQFEEGKFTHLDYKANL